MSHGHQVIECRRGERYLRDIEKNKVLVQFEMANGQPAGKPKWFDWSVVREVPDTVVGAQLVEVSAGLAKESLTLSPLSLFLLASLTTISLSLLLARSLALRANPSRSLHRRGLSGAGRLVGGEDPRQEGADIARCTSSAVASPTRRSTRI